MKPNLRVLLVLAAALVAAGAVFRQEKEMYRLRAMIAELKSHPTEAVANPLAADFEELRREAAEIHSLRAEITQLRREKVETSSVATPAPPPEGRQGPIATSCQDLVFHWTEAATQSSA